MKPRAKRGAALGALLDRAPPAEPKRRGRKRGIDRQMPLFPELASDAAAKKKRQQA